jgi:hypothetical protein
MALVVWFIRLRSWFENPSITTLMLEVERERGAA